MQAFSKTLVDYIVEQGQENEGVAVALADFLDLHNSWDAVQVHPPSGLERAAFRCGVVEGTDSAWLVIRGGLLEDDCWKFVQRETAEKEMRERFVPVLS
jgi:hypothetical protein